LKSITARRVSLSRALAIRAYLIDQGIPSLRINVQAEGDKNPGGESDRVDMFVKQSE
jgi:outer membrane protein OmpA-like peptidoglycan-associated protein